MSDARNERTLPAPEVSIGRMLPPWVCPHRDAARAWLGRCRGHAGDPLLRQLANSYRVVARRVPAKTPPQLLFVFFNALARASCAPDLCTMLFTLRTLRRWPRPNVWASFLATLTLPAGSIGKTWRETHTAALAQQALNDAAAVTFDEMRRVFEAVGPVFLGEGAPGVPIAQAPASRDTLVAFTDGKTIYLPERINLAQDREVNRWMYVSLLAHESGHLQFGTYAYDGASSEASALALRFDRTFPEGHPARSERSTRAGELPSLHRFFLRFHEPAAAKYLQNLLEDIRVDEAVARKYRTAAEAATLLETTSHRRMPSAALVSAKQSFLSALYCAARGLPVVTTITKDFARAWEKLRVDLEAWRRNPGKSIYQTLEATIDVYRDLHELVHPAVRDELFLFLSANEASGFGRTVADLDNGVAPHQRLRPVGTHPEPPEPGWIPLPEFDSTCHQLVEDAVWVDDRGPLPSPVSRSARKSGSRTGYAESGRDLELSRAYDFLVSHRTAREADARVFHRPSVTKGAVRESFTFFIDLSASMGTTAGNRARSRLATSIAYLTKAVPALESRGVATAILGGFDNGGRPFKVYRVKSFGEPLDVKALRALRTIGFGGFRVGAAIRYVSQRLGQFETASHRLLIITDDGPRYLHQSVSEILSRTMHRVCRICTVRARCSVEPFRFPPKGQRGADILSLYQPIEHEEADIRAALRETAGKILVSIHPKFLGDDRLVPFFPGGTSLEG